MKTKFSRLVFHNASNGFAIFKDEDGNAYKGYVYEQEPKKLLGVEIELKGKKVSHPKYGESFAFDSYEVIEGGNLFFLKNFVGYAKSSTLEEIASCYTKEELVKIFKENPSELLRFKGIGKKILKKMCKSFEKNYEVYELSIFLANYGVTPEFVKKIYNHFAQKGLNAKVEIQRNPYILCSLSRVGFKKIDKIALDMGIAPDSDFRLEEAYMYALENIIAQEGHSAVKKEKLFDVVKEYVELENYSFTQKRFEEIEEYLKAKKRVIEANEYITTYLLAKMESYIYKKLKMALDGYEVLELDEVREEIERIESQRGFAFGEKQKEAIELFTTYPSNFFVLAGYAGSGKTTTTKTILDMFAKKDFEIVGCALSGNASNRIKNATGYQAFTIHSLLGYQGGEFGYNEENPLPYDVVVLDEASMVSVDIMYHLVKAIDFSKTKLIMIGDNAQLPPVGAGEVFNDILENFDEVPKVVLDKVYRQNEKQAINLIAQDIRKAKVPNYKGKYEDFYFIPHDIENYWKVRKELTKEQREENNYKIFDTLIKIAKNVVYNSKNYKNAQKDAKEYISFIQYITPIKKGVLGRDRLNMALKEIFNPALENYVTIDKKEGTFFYSRGDKVIHLINKNKLCFDAPVESLWEFAIEKNDNRSERRVFNGQVGIIMDIKRVNLDEVEHIEEESDFEFYGISEENPYLLEVYYPYEHYYTYYTIPDLKSEVLDLAYAITIHKSQGSEYKNVLMPIAMSHFYMLNNKLLYTAITRGKDKTILIGESYAFESACKRAESIKRDTLYKAVGKEIEKMFNENMHQARVKLWNTPHI